MRIYEGTIWGTFLCGLEILRNKLYVMLRLQEGSINDVGRNYKWNTCQPWKRFKRLQSTLVFRNLATSRSLNFVMFDYQSRLSVNRRQVNYSISSSSTLLLNEGISLSERVQSTICSILVQYIYGYFSLLVCLIKHVLSSRIFLL